MEISGGVRGGVAVDGDEGVAWDISTGDEAAFWGRVAAEVAGDGREKAEGLVDDGV